MYKQVIPPFVKATNSCFEMMMDVTPVQRNVSMDAPAFSKSDICALIGLSGDAHGLSAISCSAAVAKRMIEEFTGESVEEIDADTLDAMGEIINIIAGAAKADIPDLSLSISLPSVVSGTDSIVHFPKGVPYLAVSFDAENIGEFQMIIGLQP